MFCEFRRFYLFLTITLNLLSSYFLFSRFYLFYFTFHVELQQRGRDHLYFIGPRDGGHSVDVEGQSVMVITPHSPIGQTLLGKTVGSVVRFGTNGTTREVRIKRVL